MIDSVGQNNMPYLYFGDMNSRFLLVLRVSVVNLLYCFLITKF